MSEFVLASDRKARVATETGLSFARVRVLRRLIPEPLTLRELAEALAADPPYVTLMIDDLEDRGLVTRRPHPSDRRAKLVTLTAPGRKLAVRAEGILGTPPSALEALSATELASLVGILERMQK
ncbi:MAG: MarR family transcriptional regulator [Thermoleophilaceae bacterium]|nr:MarR family transcriptional regulator [Thermoleophilaceae bacterium]